MACAVGSWKATAALRCLSVLGSKCYKYKTFSFRIWNSEITQAQVWLKINLNLPIKASGKILPCKESEASLCLLDPLLVIRLLPALSHNGPGNMRAVLSTCWAVSSLVFAMNWTIVFSLCRGDPTNSFLLAYPTDPISWTQVGGLPWQGESFFLKCSSCMCLCCHGEQSIIQEEPEPSVLSWLYLLLFPAAANGNDSKKFKGDVRSPGVPSRVVHVRKLPNDINEAEVISLGLPFGKVTNLLMLKGKNQVRANTCRTSHQTCVA